MSNAKPGEPVGLPPRRLIAAAVSVALGSATAPLAARADEPPPKQLPKISVEAEDVPGYKVDDSASAKYVAPLLDTPQTVTVIPRAVIDERNATTLRDVLRNTSGITFQAGEGGGGLPGDQNFTMRGFSARSSLFVDGIRDVGSYARDTFFVEQVEVAKGPAAVVGGRSATGGVINQITKTPGPEERLDFTLAAGTDTYRRATADINQPLGANAAVRLNLMYDESDVPDRDVVENERWGVAPSLALGLGDATRLTLAYLHIEQDNVPDYGLPWNTPAGEGTGLDLDFSNFYGLRGYDYEDIEADAVTLRVTHDFGPRLSLENTLRWLDTLRDSAITAPRPPNRQLQQRTQGNELWANQTNLLADFATGGIAHRLTAGVELSREKTDNRNQAQATNQPPILDVANPNPDDRPLGPMPVNVGNPGPSEATVDTVGLYVFDSAELTERWILSAGLRWDSFEVEHTQTTIATGAVTRLDNSDDVLSWQAGVVYKPAPHGSVYLSVGTSFDPAFDAGATGVALGDAPNQFNNPNLEPEKSRNYELGTKWDLAGGRLGLAAAVFHIEKTNARTRSTSNDPVTLDGEQRVDGLEVSLSGSITDRWSAFAGYTYMDSEFERSANDTEIGRALVLTPENSFNFWTTYVLPGGLEIGAGGQFVDNVFRNTTSAVEVPSYWVFDAMAAYPLTERVTLRLNATNLLDEEYVDRVGGGHFVPGPGRQISLTARFTF